MTTATRRKDTPREPAQPPQDAPKDPYPPGDFGADVLGAETVTERVGCTEELTPETEEERTARLVADAIEKLPRGPFGFLSPRPMLDAEDPAPYTVQEAISEVTRRVEPIAKDRTATQGGSYKYRGIDDVLEALHDILADVGLVILPGRAIRESWETRATSSGGTLNVARLLIRYTFVGPDGSRLTAEAWGEGGDSGDKATQKAHSQSFKTLCLQAFSIPTEASRADEPDATNEPARAWTQDELDRADRAREAAADAATLADFGGIRRRAEHLLSVPVVVGDSGAMPLSLYLDRRLAELRREEGGDRG